MNPFARGFSRIYGAAAEIKNALYDRAVLTPFDAGRPVISVGNLTVGGTGKTPIVDLCVRRLLEDGKKPGIVCRSYRASAAGPGRVDPAKPEIHGDEAAWFARRHPTVPVWSGPVKAKTARALVANENVDVVLLDDGFQHRGLKRAIDLVLLDATDADDAYACLPAGRAREPFTGLARADAVLLTKVNLAPPSRIAQLRARIAPPAGARPDGARAPAIFEFASRLNVAGLEGAKGPFVAVSGIARPESFRALLEESLPGARFEEIRYADHHPYVVADARRIADRARAIGATAVVTTEKDEIKLRPLWASDIPLKALSLEVAAHGSVESFHDVLRRAFR